jgi:hypothetical protein
VSLLVLNPIGLGTRNETRNILVLGCFGRVKPSKVMIVTPKLIVKLGLGFGVQPQ